MGKTWGPILILVGVLASAISCTDARRQKEPIPASPPAGDEPITGQPATSMRGAESPPRDPFSPYSTGPGPTEKTPKPLWSYDDLTSDERAAAVRGRDDRGWRETHDAYARASAELAQHAARQAAEHQLGAERLDGLGVVP
jgi:hypothetical protein